MRLDNRDVDPVAAAFCSGGHVVTSVLVVPTDLGKVFIPYCMFCDAAPDESPICGDLTACALAADHTGKHRSVTGKKWQ